MLLFCERKSNSSIRSTAYKKWTAFAEKRPPILLKVGRHDRAERAKGKN